MDTLRVRLILRRPEDQMHGEPGLLDPLTVPARLVWRQAGLVNGVTKQEQAEDV